jgi:hypothetical protein
MKKRMIFGFLLFIHLQTFSQDLPAAKQDWLLQRVPIKARLVKSSDGKSITLYNGLLKRTFRISPNLACVDYINLMNGRQMLRSVKAEARLTIDGKSYNIGGLYGQKENAYLLPSEIDRLVANQADFQFADYTVTPLKPYLNWKTRCWIPTAKPVEGITVSFHYRCAALQGLIVAVNYELFDGLPLMVKSLTIENKGTHKYRIDRVVNEILGMTEEESAVGKQAAELKKPQGIYFETNYAFNNSMTYPYSDQTTHWKVDSTYTSQVSYERISPCLLEIYPEVGPGLELKQGEVFQSVRTNELMINTYDREERGLAIRKMYRVIAPWALANPIFMHVVSHSTEDVRRAIDQCAATGYEALIVSFSSNLDMEDTSRTNYQTWKSIADYAHSKHILIGGYSLFSSRYISAEDEIVGHPLFNYAACFGSKWGLAYKDKIINFFAATDFDIFENDGPYPGDLCASTTHPGHKGLEDSQWTQLQTQKEIYHWMNARGIYINCPDWYFLDGTNKIPGGYRESNFSLPRETQIMLDRQNDYDNTWEKTPSMGWGFVPLTGYEGGGDAANIEPLAEHLEDYKTLMMQYYGAGIQACYRGPRLYDTPQTKEMVIGVISWYKKYRAILNADIIHLRRPDGHDWDGILHVDPDGKEKALAMLYNPLDQPITRTISLPLYYTGLNTTVTISEREGEAKTYALDRAYTVQYQVTIPAKGYTWLVIK